MGRRILIGLIVAAGVATPLLVACLWLSGQPFATDPDQGSPLLSLPIEDEEPTDLLPPPSSKVQVADGVTAPPATSRQGPPIPIIRTVKRATPPLRNTLNILLVGLDRRPGAARGGRADTLLVAVLDRSSNHVGIISIPRDLYVEIPDHGPARINATFSVARRSHTDELDLLSRVVGDTLAIPIHHSVAADLSAFERAIDAIDGITVNVPCPIQDNFIDPRQESGRRLLDVKAGRQHMDGATAAMYVRSRHGRSDWNRARRQQAVLLSVRDRILTAGGLKRAPALLEKLGTAIMTDMTRLDLLKLAGRIPNTEPEHIHGLVLGSKMTEHWTTPEGRWVLLPRYEAIDEALGSLFSAPAPGTPLPGARCQPADIALTRDGKARLRQKVKAQARKAAGGRHES